MSAYCESETLQRARGGDPEAAYALYAANLPLIGKVARKLAHIDCAVGLEDLMQEGFFAIVDAVQTYDEERGSWQQALVWELQRRYRQALPARRRKAQTVSLDAPTGEDEASTLGDCLADASAVTDAELLQEDFKHSVRRLLEERTDAQTAQIMRAHDMAGEPLGEVAERLGRSYQAMCAKRRMAMLKLRGCRELQELYRDAYDIEALTYSHSAEECAVLIMGHTRKRRKEYEGIYT